MNPVEGANSNRRNGVFSWHTVPDSQRGTEYLTQAPVGRGCRCAVEGVGLRLRGDGFVRAGDHQQIHADTDDARPVFSSACAGMASAVPSGAVTLPAEMLAAVP